MSYLIALFACLMRLIRPSQAVHADPYGRCAGVLAELRRNRARRVRRYVASSASGCSSPVIPAPREPVDSLPRPMPWVDPLMVDPRYPLPPASMVRGYYVHHVRTLAVATGVAA
ncbi:hypothetical protein [Nocardiopsis sp. JB363]|uniref:hypothetical protein n=1 Tax=Nocardiopsis sp. JB363 TaxID=1434837 RepID=UPI000B34E5C0|nr:hypothetical protein [Nocardiopsis sp. JB363]